MAQGIIYLIVNKQNGYKYVGQTTKPMNKRWQEHISEAMRMSSSPLHHAMRKYGNHNFMIKEIDECDESLLNEREEYWIKQYNTFKEGYNDKVVFNEETKQKIEVTLSNLVLDKKTNESNNKIQKNHLKRTEPWGFQLKENRGNGKHSSKRVMGINVETGEEKIWESITAAALEVNGKSGNIHGAIKNGWKAYGYRWKKLDNTTNKTPIRGVHKRTWEEIEFESISAACRYFESKNVCGIQNSLRHPHKYTYKQYYWFYN
jgi:group I intron endonuclease